MFKKPIKFADLTRILLLVVAAISGFLLSSHFVIQKKSPPFHEINWNPKEVLQTLVNKSLPKTNLLADSLRKRYDTMVDKKEAWQSKSDISQEAKENIAELRKKSGDSAASFEQIQVNVLYKIQEWLNSRSDTAIRKQFFADSSLFIHTNNLSMADYSFDTIKFLNNSKSSDTIKLSDSIILLKPSFLVTYKNLDLVGGQITDSLILSITQYKNTEYFFNKYPGFALWSLLIIVQITFYSVLIVGFLFHLFMPPGKDLYKQHMHRPNMILALLGIMLVFLFTIYFRLLKNENSMHVKGELFMMSLDKFFLLVNLLGHIAAALCLVGMISCVKYLSDIKSILESPGSPPQNLTPCSTEVEALRVEIKLRFRSYFIFIAIILTLAVFTSGTFYSSMNALEFVKQVTKDQGFSPVNSDMVYIYGILYSFFLVIIYLPLKFMLGFLDKSILSPEVPDGKQLQTNNEENPVLKALKGLTSTGMKDLLITLSPFLASFLQNLWDLIFS